MPRHRRITALSAYRQFRDRTAPAALRELAPGDFAAVAKALRLFDAAVDDGALLRRLEQEVAVKSLPARHIRF